MPPSAEHKLGLYASARLTRDVRGWGRTFEAGSTGHIVEIHGDHEAYEFELDSPKHVVTVRPDEIVEDRSET